MSAGDEILQQRSNAHGNRHNSQDDIDDVIVGPSVRGDADGFRRACADGACGRFKRDIS